MTQTITSANPLLINIVLIILAIGVPVLVFVSARFLWERKVNLGRSKELDKLIWQLHRIASALEHQMNLSFPAVQPGTEEPGDVSYLRPIATHSKPATPNTAATPNTVTPGALKPVTPEPAVQQPVTPEPVAQPTSAAAPVVEEPSEAETPRRAGVNSMFGF